jgi:hypothetical protein
MSNVILPIAIWASIGLAALSALVMGLSGLRSVWYGKVEPLTIALVAIPGVIAVVLGLVLETWVQAGIYTLVALFGLLILAIAFTGLRQIAQSAFS